MTNARTLQNLLVVGAALAGCSGQTYPLGSQEQSAGNGGATQGSSVAGGGQFAGGNSSSVQTGGTSSVPASTGGTTAVGTGGGVTAGGSNALGGSGTLPFSFGGSSVTGKTGGAPSTGGGSVTTGGTHTTGGTGASITTGGAGTTGGTGVAVPTGGAGTTGGSGVTVTTGGALNTGGASTVAGTSNAGASVGGSTASVHSRAVVMDPASNRFAAYDAEGQLVHDYLNLVNFDSSFEDRIISIEGIAQSWNGTTASPFFSEVTFAPPGQEPPLQASEILVRARRVGGGSVNLRVANVGGQVVDEFSIAGDWEVFRPSPTRKYWLGGIGSTTGVVVRRSDHSVVWQGALFDASFAPDDQHLVVVPNNSANTLSIVDLSTGQAVSVNLAQLPAAFTSPSPNLLSVKGAFNSGAAVSIYRSVYTGQNLFWLSWDGMLTPFDPTVPDKVVEYVSTANTNATRLLWWRNQYTSGVSVDPSILGWFELDLASMTNRAVTNLSKTDKSCYDPTVTNYYGTSNGVLLSCTCDTAACTSFATLPSQADNAWSPQAVVSQQRGLVGVEYSWALSRSPDTPATTPLYSAQGTLLTTVDCGKFGFDRLDQLTLASTSFPSTFDVVIISPTSGHQTSLNNPKRAVIGYE
jgi:hypothetical protein